MPVALAKGTLQHGPIWLNEIVMVVWTSFKILITFLNAHFDFVVRREILIFHQFFCASLYIDGPI